MRQATVMVVEQQRGTALRFERQLRQLGYAVAAPLASVEQALAAVAQQRPDAVLVDVRMAHSASGRDGLRRLHDRSGAPMIFRAPHGDQRDFEEAIAALAYGYLVTPCSLQEIQAAFSIALARRAAEINCASGEGRLQRLFDSVPLLLAYLDTSGHYQVANRLHEKWFGIPADKMPGRSLLEVLGPDWLESLRSAFAQAAAGHPVSIEHHAQDPEDRHAQVYLVPDRTAEGVRGVYLAACNISSRVESERVLREELEQLRATIDALGDGVIAFDAAGRVRYANSAAQTLARRSGGQARGLPAEQLLRFVDSATGQRIESPLQKALSTGRSAHLPPGAVLLSPDGTEYAVEERCSPVRDAAGNTVGAVLVLHDAGGGDTRAGQASHDPLTGLANGSQFQKTLDARLESARLTGQQHALLHIDVAHLSEINDTYGHHAGDALLRRLAELLSAKLRSCDLLARVSGDEFAMLIEDCPPQRAQQIAQTVLSTAREAGFDWQGRSVGLSLSIGAATIDDPVMDAAAALRASQLACVLAKENGGGLVSVCSSDPEKAHGSTAEAVDWSGRIVEALARDRFHLFAQRVAAVDDPEGREHCTYEILLRLEGRNGTLLPPMAFMPAAERCALMPELDRWVIAHTLRALSPRQPTARADGDDHPRYAINLSPASLADDGLLAYIAGQLQETSVPPEQICFEIAEGAALTQLHRASTLAQGLKELGCAFALDHFSSGMSAREYLQHLPVAYIKIDGSFVKGMLEDKLDCAVVEGISRIGEALGIETVAEHAESAAILFKLRQVGVTQAQGYIIHRPEPLLQALESQADLLAAAHALRGGGGNWAVEWYLH